LQDAETNSIPLANIPIELRNGSGAVFESAMTTSAGTFQFPGLPVGSYYISAVADRTQSASPTQALVHPGDGPISFTMRNVPAIVTITGTAGTFAIITPGAIAGNTPPSTGASFSATMGLDNKNVLKVPQGAWFLTCWTMTNNTYTKGPSINIGTLHPQDTLTEACQ
jgi:hypothetical protein